VTGMLHKVTAGGRIIHMEDKEIIGILDGLISKRVRAKGYDEAIFARAENAKKYIPFWA
jgi:hypothetical protein